MTETREIIDFTHLEPTRVSRWDRGDGAGAIRTLVEACDEAGCPGELSASLRLLGEAEEMAADALAAKQRAEQCWAEEEARLRTARLDPDRLARTLVEFGPWLTSNIEAGQAPLAMAAAMAAVSWRRSNAAQMAFAETTGIYGRLAAAAREVVGQVAALPKLPPAVWAATSTAAASQTAIGAGAGRTWEDLVLLGMRWDAVHRAGELVRETGTLEQQTMFAAGCPRSIGCMFLAWEEAVDAVRDLRRLPGPLRVRAAVDRQLLPGLYLVADHQAHQAQQPKRRGLVGAVGGLLGH